MLIIKLAFRNIFRQKRRSLLTALSMFGGFVLAAVFIGWSDGTYDNIIDEFTRNRLGHIQIHQVDYLDRPALYKTIASEEDLDGLLGGEKRIDSWTARIYSGGLASVADKSSGCRIIGIDPLRENMTTRFNDKIIAGRPLSQQPSRETILGKGLARLLKADLQDELVIVSQAADGSVANDLYRVVAILDSGDELGDRQSLYLHIDDSQELLALGSRIHEIAVTVQQLDRVQSVTESLGRVINNPDIKVTAWQEFARSFYLAMKVDQEGMWIMLVVIIIVVAVGVLNTVLMAVLERRREYGVLRAVGTKPRQIFNMVMLEVNILGVFCILTGIAVGLILNLILTNHGINLPEPITYGGMKFQTMKSQINARSFYLPALTVLLSASLVCLLPAIKAAKTEPAKSMRIH